MMMVAALQFKVTCCFPAVVFYLLLSVWHGVLLLFPLEVLKK